MSELVVEVFNGFIFVPQHFLKADNLSVQFYDIVSCCSFFIEIDLQCLYLHHYIFFFFDCLGEFFLDVRILSSQLNDFQV